jgi:hypothetical protein
MIVGEKTIEAGKLMVETLEQMVGREEMLRLIQQRLDDPKDNMLEVPDFFLAPLRGYIQTAIGNYLSHGARFREGVIQEREAAERLRQQEAITPLEPIAPMEPTVPLGADGLMAGEGPGWPVEAFEESSEETEKREKREKRDDG